MNSHASAPPLGLTDSGGGVADSAHSAELAGAGAAARAGATSLRTAAARAAGRGAFDYRRYPAFGWSWSWRRSVIFGAFTGAFAVWEAITVGVLSGDRHIGLATAAVAIPTWLALVSIGPLLGAFVRSRGWPLERERLGVVLSVLAGVAVGGAGQWYADEFNRNVLLPTLLAHHVLGENYLVNLHALVRPPALLLAQSLLFFLLSGGLALRTYFGEQRRLVAEVREREIEALQLQARQADLQLLVLQAQIEPHFLFNTLASLRSLLRTDVQHAEAMIDALVEHLRATVPIFRQSSAGSTLAEQLRICGSYLELMQVRLPDRLSYSISVPDGLRSAAFPPLILLTLVENAVKHGIEPKPGPGHIRIDACCEQRADGTHVLVSVADDGVGLAAGLGHGMGLANIHAQLALKYGERAALSLAGIPRGGTVACIDIPEDGRRAP